MAIYVLFARIKNQRKKKPNKRKSIKLTNMNEREKSKPVTSVEAGWMNTREDAKCVTEKS